MLVKSEIVYSQMRSEIVARIKVLHSILLWSSMLLGASVIFAVYLSSVNASQTLIITYILSLPIVFSLIGFNYQANQMTMESVARYLKHHIETEEPEAEFLSWEMFYASQKSKYELVSFLKVVPILMPQLLPIAVIVFLGELPNLVFQQWLIAIDLALFVLLIFDFRYKIPSK